MEQGNLMVDLLNTRIDYPILNYYFINLARVEQEKFKEIIQNMKRGNLYKSPIHGVYHSEKVCLFAFLLGQKFGLDEEDMQILTDAAMYHDFKRQNDFEDPFHGMVSANHIEEIVPLGAVYSSRVNLTILKAIIDFHSQPDRKLRLNFDNYELPEASFNRYQRLAYLLKDADALDRARFSEKCQASLKPEYLHFPASMLMIELAKEVNEAYNKLMERNWNDEIPLDKITGDCLHSIGFDFFRITSVLENGVLSFSEMKKVGIDFPRNFDGGNSTRWISVVPTSCIKDDEKAFTTFIQNGMSFFCSKQLLYAPMEFNKKSVAILKGLPYDKSGYLDERYVFQKIDEEAIKSIFVVKEYAEKDVKELSYLYNTLYYGTLENKVIYLLNNMGVKGIDLVPDLIEPMARYKKELDDYGAIDIIERIMVTPKMKKTLNTLLEEINAIIQRLIHNYYACMLKRPLDSKITVADVMKFELSKVNKKITMIDGPDELLFFIDEPQKKKLK